MREIKFRAWDPNNKKLYQNVNLGNNGRVEFCWNTDAGGKRLISFPGYSSDGVDYSAIIPMQFTGLEDANGREIYEGDICQNGDWEPDAHAYNYRTEVVQWVEGEGCYRGWSFNIDGMTCEVIGNIYENPELLKAADKAD